MFAKPNILNLGWGSFPSGKLSRKASHGFPKLDLMNTQWRTKVFCVAIATSRGSQAC